jgi:hypothetical protein
MVFERDENLQNKDLSFFGNLFKEMTSHPVRQAGQKSQSLSSSAKFDKLSYQCCIPMKKYNS